MRKVALTKKGGDVLATKAFFIATVLPCVISISFEFAAVKAPMFNPETELVAGATTDVATVLYC